MRMPETIPISTRELIWNLPELLEGDEPVLKRPAVRDYLRTDPAARAALLAVAEMANALTGASEWMHRMPTVVPRVLSRPVQVAKRYFAAELVDVLFEVARSLVDAKARSSGIYCQRGDADRPRNRDELATAAIAKLSEALTTESHDLPSMLRSAREAQEAQGLLQACDTLSPGLGGVAYLRLFDRDLSFHASSGTRWIALARTACFPPIRASALVRAAICRATAGHFASAFELDWQATRIAPGEWTAQYHAALHGALAGRDAEATRAMDDWIAAAGSSDMISTVFACGIRSDAASWSKALGASPIVRRAALTRQPAKLRRAFDEVLS